MAARVTLDPRQVIGNVNEFGEDVSRATTTTELVAALRRGIELCELVAQWTGGSTLPPPIASLARANRTPHETSVPEWALAAKAKRRAEVAHHAILRVLRAPEKRTPWALQRIELLLQSVAATFYQIDAARLRELKRRTSFDYESIRA